MADEKTNNVYLTHNSGLKWLAFGFGGRINSKQMLISGLGVYTIAIFSYLAFALLFLIIPTIIFSTIFGVVAGGFIFLMLFSFVIAMFFFLAFWINFALIVKRFHDCGISIKRTIKFGLGSCAILAFALSISYGSLIAGLGIFLILTSFFILILFLLGLVWRRSETSNEFGDSNLPSEIHQNGKIIDDPDYLSTGLKWLFTSTEGRLTRTQFMVYTTGTYIILNYIVIIFSPLFKVDIPLNNSRSEVFDYINNAVFLNYISLFLIIACLSCLVIKRVNDFLDDKKWGYIIAGFLTLTPLVLLIGTPSFQGDVVISEYLSIKETLIDQLLFSSTNIDIAQFEIILDSLNHILLENYLSIYAHELPTSSAYGNLLFWCWVIIFSALLMIPGSAGANQNGLARHDNLLT